MKTYSSEPVKHLVPVTIQQVRKALSMDLEDKSKGSIRIVL